MRTGWIPSGVRAPWPALLALFLVTLSAHAADPVPDLGDDHVAVARGVPGNFDELRGFVKGFESRAGAQYAVCVVRFTDPGNRSGKRPESTVQYVDQVFAAWQGRLDARKHVIVALSTENRGIAIHPGSDWASFGFEKNAITRVIDGSSFAVTARSGNIPLALEQLIRAVDLHLSIQTANAAKRAERIRSALERLPQRFEALANEAGARSFDTQEVAELLGDARTLADRIDGLLEASDVPAAARMLDVVNNRLVAAERSLARLDAHERELEKLRKRAPEELRLVREELQRVEQRLRAAPYDATSLLADAAGIAESLDEADRTLFQGDPVKAARQALNVRRWVQQLERAAVEAEAAHEHALEQLELARARSVEIADLLDERERRLSDVPYRTDALTPVLATARDAWNTGDAALADGRADAALQAFSDAELRVARLDADITSAEKDHRFRTVVLPRGLAVAAALVLFLLLLFHWLVRRSRRGTATKRIARWERMLGRAGTRLVKLRDDHPYLFGSQRLYQRYEGETARVYHEVGEQVDDLFLSYGSARIQLTLAQDRLETAGLAGWAAYDRAAELLESDEVVLRREAVDDQQLFLPETRVIKRRADDLLEQMGEVYEAVYAAVDDLERRVLVAPRTLEEVVDLCAQGEDALANIVKAGLYPDVIAAEHEALTTRQESLGKSVSVDPIGNIDAASVLRVDALALRDRLGRNEEAALLLRDVLDTRLPATVGELDRLRREERMRLEEPGFEPDAMIGAARSAAESVRRHTQSGADGDALAAARQADVTVQGLDDLIARSVLSRDETPGHVDGLRDEERRLRERLPERRERLAELATRHAAEALQPALDNAEEALAALDFSVRCMDDAQAAITQEAQRYLAGAELARRALDVLRSVAALYEEIETKSDELDEARRKAEEGLAEANGLALDVARLIAQDSFASAAILGEEQSLREGLAFVQSLFDVDLPDWPGNRRAAQDLRDAARATLLRTREEHAAYVAAMAMQRDVEEDFHRVERLLAGSSEDRAPANRCLHDGRSVLTESVTERTKEHPNWATVLLLLEDVREAVAEAERLAQQDFAAADAARDAIASAETAVARANRHYGRGVRAPLAFSRHALTEATMMLAAAHYEAAREQAEESRDRAQSARRSALRKVRALEEAEAAEALAALRARRKLAARQSSSSSFGSSSFGSSFGSSSGGSSFGSSSGGSSFGRSSSGGSSFGGSSSGGSSW